MRILKILLAAVLVIGGGWSARTMANGGETAGATPPPLFIQIAPATSRLALHAGDENEYSLVVKNIGTEDFRFRVYAAPYSFAGGDGSLDFEKEKLHTQLYKWVSFGQDEGKLAVGEEARIDYRVKVPENALDGGQYAAIFAETGGEGEIAEGESGVRSVIRVSSLLYARVGNAVVEDVAVKFGAPFLRVKSPVLGRVRVINRGNVEAAAKMSFEVLGLFGGEALHEAEDEKLILPDTEDGAGRNFEFEWEDSPNFGLFRVKMTAVVEGEEYESWRLVLVAPVAFVVIFLVLLGLFGVWVGIIIRNKKRRRRWTAR